MSVRLVRSSIMELSDTASKDTVQKTRRAILAHEGVRDCQNLKVRKVGTKTFVECTLQVSSFMSLEEAHALASELEENLLKILGNVDATIHIEPAEKETRIEQLVEKLSVVEGVNEVHDIVTVYSTGKLYITLHAFVSPQLSVEEAHEIAERIEKRMHQGIKDLENVTVHVEPYSAEKSGAVVNENELEGLIDQLAIRFKTNLTLKRTVSYQASGKLYINIDCCFTRQVPLTEAHNIASQIEKEISEHFAEAAVTVHMEPECT
jgi:divalent metal cation (Fe/Co/Zn/Cd) transporter